MNLLLDTHVFIWLTANADRVSETARTLVADSENTKYFSLVSAWEIQIKMQLGKLTLKDDLAKIITAQQQENGVKLLPIMLEHIVELGNLPMHHRDPFDRLLIAQARVEKFTLLSHDSQFEPYDVPVMW